MYWNADSLYPGLMVMNTGLARQTTNKNYDPSQVNENGHIFTWKHGTEFPFCNINSNNSKEQTRVQAERTLSKSILWIYAAIVHIKYVHIIVTEKVASNSISLQHFQPMQMYNRWMQKYQYSIKESHTVNKTDMQKDTQAVSFVQPSDASTTVWPSSAGYLKGKKVVYKFVQHFLYDTHL